jgi:hypothetical protein
MQAFLLQAGAFAIGATMAFGQQALTNAPADAQLDSNQFAERALYRHAVEGVNWGMPIVNYDLMYQAMVRDDGTWTPSPVNRTE